MRHRGIEVEETPLKKLELPNALQLSIENKLEAEQASQKMAFVLQKERWALLPAVHRLLSEAHRLRLTTCCLLPAACCRTA